MLRSFPAHVTLWYCTAGFALLKTVGAVGSFTGPFLIGALADSQGTYTRAIETLAAFLLIAAGLNIGFPGPGYKPVSA